MVGQEDREVKPHQEETEVVNLGVGDERKEVKVTTGMSSNIRDKSVVLLRDYQDIFAWSHQDMPGLSFDLVQHRLPLNPECSPIKQKMRRTKPEMSLKIKEEMKKQFELASRPLLGTRNGLPTSCQSLKRMERGKCAWTIGIETEPVQRITILCHTSISVIL